MDSLFYGDINHYMTYRMTSMYSKYVVK